MSEVQEKLRKPAVHGDGGVEVICGDARRVLELVAGRVSTAKARSRGRVTGHYLLQRVQQLVKERQVLRAVLSSSRFPPERGSLVEQVRQLVTEREALVDRWVDAELVLKANGLPVPGEAGQGRAAS